MPIKSGPLAVEPYQLLFSSCRAPCPLPSFIFCTCSCLCLKYLMLPLFLTPGWLVHPSSLTWGIMLSYKKSSPCLVSQVWVKCPLPCASRSITLYSPSGCSSCHTASSSPVRWLWAPGEQERGLPCSSLYPQHLVECLTQWPYKVVLVIPDLPIYHSSRDSSHIHFWVPPVQSLINFSSKYLRTW